MAEDAARMHVSIHPLVIMNVAEHYTRAKAQYGASRVVGALFGVQNGREVRIYDSFGMSLAEGKDGGDKVKLATEAFEKDMKLYTEVYADREFLGWYSSGDAVRPGDLALHDAVSAYNERPLFLLLDPKVDATSRDLPLALYEQEVHLVEDQSTREFVRAPFTVESDEAERIAAVHCAKVVASGGASAADAASPVSSHLTVLHRSVKHLNERVGVLLAYLRDVEEGRVPADSDLLREVKGICNRLPVMDSENSQFGNEFGDEYNDALLVTYLASVTKGAESMAKTLGHFGATHERGAAGPGMRRGPRDHYGGARGGPGGGGGGPSRRRAPGGRHF